MSARWKERGRKRKRKKRRERERRARPLSSEVSREVVFRHIFFPKSCVIFAQRLPKDIIRIKRDNV